MTAPYINDVGEERTAATRMEVEEAEESTAAAQMEHASSPHSRRHREELESWDLIYIPPFIPKARQNITGYAIPFVPKAQKLAAFGARGDRVIVFSVGAFTGVCFMLVWN